MAAMRARKKAVKGKRRPKAVRRSTGKAKAKLTTRAKATIRGKTSPGKPSRKKRSLATQKKGTKHTRSPLSEDKKHLAPDSAGRRTIVVPPPPVEPPPRLLRESKSITAALSMLEKGIKFLYQKDIKRARAEFNALIEAHPGEAEILARTRSYLQICDKEEALRKKAGVSTTDFYSLGVMEHNRGNYEGAISSFRKGLEQHPDSEHIVYSLAASLASQGESAEAIQVLRRAIELNEDNRVYAKNDSDFSSLHTNRDFTDLVGLSPSPASS